MGPERLEDTMFLKLKLHLIPEAKELIGHRLGESDVLAEGKVKAAKSHAADARRSVVADCSF